MVRHTQTLSLAAGILYVRTWMGALINSDLSVGDDKDGVGGLTAEDLELGKRAVKIIGILAAVALAVSIGITVFVFMSVPWETRLPYEGQYGRNGLPMQVAMSMCILSQVIFWRVGKKPTAHHMGKASRGLYYVLAPVMIVGAVWGQCVLAKSILVEGGALPC